MLKHSREPFCNRSSPALCFTALFKPLLAAASFFCFSCVFTKPVSFTGQTC